MNIFSNFGSQLFRGSVSTNSASYINKQNVNVLLDPSGTDYIDYSNNNNYFKDAHGINLNDENTTSLIIPFYLSTLDDFTLCVKYKLHDDSSSNAFLGQHFISPVYDVSLSTTNANAGDNITITVTKGSNESIQYIIQGDLTSENLGITDMSGILTEVESVLQYTIQSGSGNFIFTIEGTDVSGTVNVSKTYWVTIQTNVLGEKVFAFSETGPSGPFYNQKNISFTAGDLIRFDVSDPSNNDFVLDFGSTVDVASTGDVLSYISRTGTPGQSNSTVTLSIPESYSGDAIHYFEDSSANMGLDQVYYNMTLPNKDLLYNGTTWTNTLGHSQFDISVNLSASEMKPGNNTIQNVFTNTVGPSVVLGSSAYYTVNPVDYSGSTVTAASSQTISGEWIEWEFPYAVRLYSIQLNKDYESVSNAYKTLLSNTWPQLVSLVGSNDGIAWTFIEQVNTGVTASAYSAAGKASAVSNGYNVVEVNNSQYFTYYRMIVESIVNDGGVDISYALAMSPRIGEIHLGCDIYTVSGESIYVTVSGSPEVFHLNGVSRDPIAFTSGTTYYFDQSDTSNTGNTFVLGTVPDSSINLIDYQTIVGTPGQPGAYTSFTASGETVFYYSFETPFMGNEPPTYKVKTDTNVLGDTVFSIKKPGETEYYIQPDLSFGAGFVGHFDVSGIGSYNLVFGTEVDVSSSIQTQYFSQTGDIIFLSIPSEYSGNSLKYFEDTSAGMGYVSSSTANIYTVTVSNEVFYIDGSANPLLTFTSGDTYAFDLSHNSNTGNTLVLGTVPDSSTNLIDYQTIVGTPGQPGSYTTFTASGETVFYYSFETPFMGYEPPTYTVQTEINVLGDTVFSIKKPGETEYYIQPDLSFGAGFVGHFDVSGIGSYNLVFGTEVDVSSSIQTQYYSQNGDIIFLSIPSEYSGNSLKYFEDTSAGMGYVSSSTANIYTVTVSNEVFYIDGSANPLLTFTSGDTYAFDLSHNSNEGNTLVLGTVPDSSVNLIDYQTIVGTPGQPGSYTTFTASGETVFYYSFETPFMGYEPPTYTVQTEINVLGDTVFSIKKPGETVYYIQPDLSFGAGFVGQFDVADIDGSYNLVFGTEVDVSSSIQTQYFSQNGDVILLSIPSEYSGNSLKYFEDTSAGMGYVSSSTANIYTVTVSNEVFYIDGSANPLLTFTSGDTYSFDLSHNSNAGNTLVLGTEPDFSTNLIDYQTIVGTPGQPGAYTTFTASGEIVFYYSFETPGMGYEPPTYTVQTEINVLGDTVFSIKKPGETEYYIQPDLSFGAGFVGQFDVSGIGSYNLVFGTEVDVSNTIQTQYFSQNGDVILLSIPSEYSGNSLKYFEDTSAGMGYVSSSTANIYTVTVSNEVFYIDGSANPLLTFTSGDTYAFDLSHNSNAGNTLVLGTVPDSSTNLIDYQTIVGTPGQPGAYTSFTASGETVYYYSFETPFMGNEPPTYTVQTEINVLGDTVFSIKKPGETVYYAQPDLSFGAGFVGQFDVSGIGSYNLVFGTEVDVSNTIQTQYFSQNGDVILLSIPSEYSGNSLKYFEDTSAGMGYVSSSTANIYTVTVSNEVFYIDGSANPLLTFTSGDTYAFDLSHNSNTGNTLVLGTVPDSSTNLIDYQTIVGTPGQPGSYTSFTASGETVYYYSFETPDMGYEPPTYTVQTEINVLGDTVFSIKKPGETVYYAQPDLSFGAGFVGHFDVSGIGSYNLVFGTEVDVSSSIQTQYYSQNGDIIFLSIPAEYSGNSLKYFEDTSAGMGYVEASSTSTNIPIIFSGVTEPKFYWDFRTTTPLTNGSETFVEDIMDVSNTNLKAVAKGGLLFNSLTGPTFNSTDYIQIDPFSFGGKCSLEVYYYVTSFTTWQRVLCFANTTGLSNRYIITSAIGTTTNFGVSLQDGSSVLSSSGSTPTTTSLNTWYQAVVTLDENGSLEAYVNKVDQGYNTTITLPEQQRIYNLVGRANNTDNQGMNGQIGYVRIWQDHVLTTSEISNLYDTRSIPYGFITIKGGYTVTVSNEVFYIDGSANPQLTFTSGEIYVFDQSDTTNAGNTLVLGTVPDSSVNLIDYQTIVGTPGQPGAYTTFTASGETVYYYSFETPDMGYEPPTYKVKTEINVVGDTVFSIQKPDENVFYTQPDLSFGAGFVGQFDVSGIGSYNLVFGTEVDVSNTIQTQYYSQNGDIIFLSIPSDYSGYSLKYFEDTSAGMGYVQLVTNTITTLNPNIFNNVTNPRYYWDFREITNNTYVTDLINGIIKANAIGSLAFNDSSGATFNSTDYIQIEPFTFGGKCSVEVYFKVTTAIGWQRVIDFGQGSADDNFVIISRYHSSNPPKIASQLFNGQSGSTIQGSAISTNTWHHVVVTVDAINNADVKIYLDSSPDATGSSITIPNEERTSNLVGRDNWGGGSYMDGQIAYVRIWQDHALTGTEITNLYNTKDFEVFVDVGPTSYIVEVSNSVFWLDSGDGNGFVEKLYINFNSGTTYIFNQSHNTNTGNTFVLGTVRDSSVNLIDYQTIVGTPGQPGAYTTFTASGESVYYYSFETPNMGYEPIPDIWMKLTEPSDISGTYIGNYNGYTNEFAYNTMSTSNTVNIGTYYDISCAYLNQNGYIKFPSGNLLKFCVMCYVYIDNSTTDFCRLIKLSGENGGQGNMDGIVFGSAGIYDKDFSAYPNTKDAWVHLKVNYDRVGGNVTKYVFIDDVLVETYTVTGASFNTDNFVIGQQDGTLLKSKFYMYDFRIYKGIHL